MLKLVAEKLDKWIEKENKEALDEGRPLIKTVTIKVIGQTALMEAKLSFPLAATMDVDCFNQFNSIVRQKFNELLNQEGKTLDEIGHEAWMPEETEFHSLYEGKKVHMEIALPHFVILSKAKKAFEKNKGLIAEYIASKDIHPDFFDLVEKYEINLDKLWTK